MRTVEEEYRIECLEHLQDSIAHWDVHRSDDNEMSKEEGYLLWSLEAAIYNLKEFYKKEK